MIRTRTAFVNALVIVLVAVTGWAAYETRRASAAEQKLATSKRKVAYSLKALKETAKLLRAGLDLVTNYPATGTTARSNDLMKQTARLSATYVDSELSVLEAETWEQVGQVASPLATKNSPVATENLDRVRDAAMDAKVSTEVGVSYTDFGPKLHRFATEVALAKEAGAHSEAFGKYELAVKTYTGCYGLWGSTLSIRYPRGQGMPELIAQNKRLLQEGWLSGASNIEQAMTLQR